MIPLPTEGSPRRDPLPECRRRALPGLRAHLLVLVLAVLVPALAIGATAAWYAAESYRMASASRLLDTARALALALDAEIGRAEGALTGLAVSHGLDTLGDLAAFDAQARSVAAALGAPIVVSGPGPDYRRIIDTSVPPDGTAPGAMERVDAAANAPVAQVFATGHTAVGNLARARPGEGAQAAVVVPVVRDGRTAWAMGMALTPARLSALLAAQGLSDGAFAALADARGILVARSRNPDRYVGRPADGWYAEPPVPSASGVSVAQARSAEGEAVLLASYRLAAAPGWVVAVATPYAAYQASWQAPLRGLAVAAAMALALAAALAAWLARRLLRPVEALARSARNVALAGGSGTEHAIAAPPSSVAEFEALRLGIGDAEAALRRRAEAERRAATALRESDRRMQELRSEFLRVARLSEMGQMAATLAHELNQPLAAAANYISGARRLLQRDAVAAGREPDPAASEALARAAGETVRAGQIVRRMRGLVFRSEAEKQAEDPARLIEEAGELALILARHAHVDFRLDLDRRAPRVLADRVQVQQVLLNLMHNAIEAMAEQQEGSGGGTLTVTLRAEDDGFVEIGVADTGPGLPPEVKADLFAAFVTTKPGGVGVGLSVCRTIVEGHGGRIWAEPNPGGGTVFRFTLPAAAVVERHESARAS